MVMLHDSRCHWFCIHCGSTLVCSVSQSEFISTLLAFLSPNIRTHVDVAKKEKKDECKKDCKFFCFTAILARLHVTWAEEQSWINQIIIIFKTVSLSQVPGIEIPI